MRSKELLLSATLLLGVCLVAAGMRPASAQSANAVPDNSAQNERDRDGQTLTPDRSVEQA
jgi:hypothetical protein